MQDRSPPTRRNLLASHGRTIRRGRSRRFGGQPRISGLPRATDIFLGSRKASKRATGGHQLWVPECTLMTREGGLERQKNVCGPTSAESARTMGVSVCSLHIRDVKRRATNPAGKPWSVRVIVRGDNLRNANSISCSCAVVYAQAKRRQRAA